MGFPIGSSVYFVFALINCLSFSPVSGSENSNDSRTMREANSQHATDILAKAKEPSWANTRDAWTLSNATSYPATDAQAKARRVRSMEGLGHGSLSD